MFHVIEAVLHSLTSVRHIPVTQLCMKNGDHRDEVGVIRQCTSIFHGRPLALQVVLLTALADLLQGVRLQVAQRETLLGTMFLCSLSFPDLQN